MFGLSPLTIIAICIAAMIIIGLYMVISIQTRIKKRVKGHVFCVIRSKDGIFDFGLLPIKGTKIKAPHGNKDIAGGMWLISDQHTVGTTEYPPLYPKFFQTRCPTVEVHRGQPNTIAFSNTVAPLTEEALDALDSEKTAEMIAMRMEKATKEELKQSEMKLSLVQLIVIGVIVIGVVFNAWLGIQNVNTLQHLLMAMGYS